MTKRMRVDENRAIHGLGQFVALTRLERPGGGFVEAGEIISLDEGTAALLLDLGFVAGNALAHPTADDEHV